MTKAEEKQAEKNMKEMRETIAALHMMSTKEAQLLVTIPGCSFLFDARFKANFGKAANALARVANLTDSQVSVDLAQMLTGLRLMAEQKMAAGTNGGAVAKPEEKPAEEQLGG